MGYMTTKNLLPVTFSKLCSCPKYLSTSHVCSADNFANSLNPDQARQDIGHDLDPNCLNSLSLIVFQEKLFEKINFGKEISRFKQTMQ